MAASSCRCNPAAQAPAPPPAPLSESLSAVGSSSPPRRSFALAGRGLAAARAPADPPPGPPKGCGSCGGVRGRWRRVRRRRRASRGVWCWEGVLAARAPAGPLRRRFKRRPSSLTTAESLLAAGLAGVGVVGSAPLEEVRCPRGPRRALPIAEVRLPRLPLEGPHGGEGKLPGERQPGVWRRRRFALVANVVAAQGPGKGLCSDEGADACPGCQ